MQWAQQHIPDANIPPELARLENLGQDIAADALGIEERRENARQNGSEEAPSKKRGRPNQVKTKNDEKLFREWDCWTGYTALGKKEKLVVDFAATKNISKGEMQRAIHNGRNTWNRRKK